jgi:hypothetical protein
MRLFRRRLLALAFLGTMVAAPALAQPAAPVTYPPPCDPSHVSKADIERAHTVFLSGKQYLEESNYEKAISYFNDAYSIDCSVHGMLPIIATAYERKGDKPEAIRALEEYQRRAPNAPDHEVIERRLRNLNDQVARDQAAAAVAVPPPPPPPPSAPTPSSAPTTTAAPTASVASPPLPTKPPDAEPPQHHSAIPWVVVGVGGAVIVAGGITWLVGDGKVKSAESTCPIHNSCMSASAISTGNDGRNLENVGGYLLGGGLVVVAAGLIWHFVEGPGKPPPPAAVAPVIAPGYAGVGVAGSF